MTLLQSLRQVLTREVVGICCLVFASDIATGILTPTFSLYAKSLGATVVMIGLLSAVVGLTRIFVAVPIGVLSDTRGRRNVLSAGMLLFTVSYLCYVFIPNAYWLFPARALSGLANICVYFIAVAYIGDIVPKHQRGLAIGLYATSMGTAFAIGPMIGGTIASSYGYQASYLVAALSAFSGFLVTRVMLTQAGSHPSATASSLSLAAKLSLMAKDPNLLAASLANMFMSEIFGGVIVNFFPLYAASFAIKDDMIGYMFSLRGFTSAVARLPTGVLTTKFSSRSLMLCSLALGMTMAFAISLASDPVILTLCLAGEGLSFGMFLTSGQTFVTEHSPAANRGAAMAVYSTAGSIGSTVGPFMFGVVAQLWGLAAVFRFTAGLVLIGVCLLVYLGLRQRAVPVAGADGRAI